MSAYIVAGYLLVLGALAAYAASLLGREGVLRRRLPAPRPRGGLRGDPRVADELGRREQR